MPENSIAGLTSLRDERFSAVARYCRGRVLDIGCGRGNLFIRNWIGEKNGVGVDVFAYDGVQNVVEDMTALPWPNGSFDTVTLIAVGGHIPKSKRVTEFAEFARLLASGGRLIMTEGEPVTQTLGHWWRHFSYALVGKQDMDHERGMETDEEYCMPRAEIFALLNTAPLKLIQRRRFMWGLNNIYIAEKT